MTQLSMEKTYYYSLDGGQQQGPVTLAELKSKGITRESLVWTEGMPQWQQAQTLPELSGLFADSLQAPPDLPLDTQTNNPNKEVLIKEVVRPKSWLVEAILLTLFCCLPSGIIAIVFACKVDTAFSRGDYNGAKMASETARKWVVGTVACYLVILTIGLLFVLISSISNNNTTVANL